MHASPLVTSFVVASNAAVDADQSLVAINVFNSIPAVTVPWRFASAPYVILSALHVEDREHTFTVHPIRRCTFGTPTVRARPVGGAILTAIRISDWIILEYGDVQFQVSMDGVPLYLGTLLCYPGKS